MFRRVVVVVVLVAMLLAVAAGVWAAKRSKGCEDCSRCLTTCNTLVKYYTQKLPTMKSHEGDKQCWQTCDARFNQSAGPRDAKAMKAFWAGKRAANLRANQCAKACWRKFHSGSQTVNASQPRGTGLHEVRADEATCVAAGRFGRADAPVPFGYACLGKARLPCSWARWATREKHGARVARDQRRPPSGGVCDGRVLSRSSTRLGSSLGEGRLLYGSLRACPPR